MKKYFIYLLCSFQFVQGMYTPTIKTTLTAINALVFMADCNIDCKIHDEIARHPTWENQLNQHAKASGRMSAWIVPSQITMSSVCISHD